MNPIPWHARALDDALERWDADPVAGLSIERARSRRAKLGDNTLPAGERTSAIRQILSQFADPLVGALLVAALVSLGVAFTSEAHAGFLARFGDTFAILLIVAVNALLGFFQERRAERALEALQKMAAPNATVIRGGKKSVIPARELVPGDLIELVAGDAAPADVRLVEAVELATEEAALTGESTSVAKRADAVHDEMTTLAERANMVYLGTTVVRGRGLGVVVATGVYTELGRIGTLMRDVETVDTPLEQRLNRLGKIILVICLGLSVALFLIGLATGGRSWTVMLLTAVSLAVAAIPEGLPAITTITLALGMQRMAHRGAIVRKLPAVETLGSATVICTDKTGTLTQNAMTVRAVETFEARFHVEGGGYAADGAVVGEDGPVTEPGRALRALAEVAAICNDASFDHSEGDPKLLGDPTEGALLVLARKLGVERETLLAQKTIEATRPFDGDRKRMSVVADRVAYVKGSPDSLIERCTHALTDEGPVPLDDAGRARLHESTEAYAKDALRVLALAMRDEPDPEAVESNLVFVGLAAMIDPPRPEVKDAIAECRRAGIRVVMITGDHAVTAAAIARELGLWSEDALAMTGAQLADTTEQELEARIERVAVFARTTAEQKLRIVRALQRRGHVAAMTGDGVNDAPALREAQIGVAMGLGGTDVARDASEMVLADDNFATIVHAVREGRAIFRNIQKFIFFLNSSNAGLVVAVILGSFFEWPQLTPLQLLWVNLVTNGLPALALGVDPPDPSQMEERPRRPDEGIVGWRDFFGMLLVGSVMGGAALGVMWLPDVAPAMFEGVGRAEALARCRAMAFTVLALSPLFHAFNCRSRLRSALARPFENRALWLAIAVSAAVHSVTIVVPGLHDVFRTHLFSAAEWGVVLALAFLPVPVFEVAKLIARATRQSR
ncbi:MAG: calcium-translocating P-type ATPase, SERCA-type [Sandaracinaceae bacterium]|nr:calcium-translocating P-type ATPase, SERCA-type [Sandaracinaceae bacterium]